ncbi:hypothetical protein BV22DRAFT_1130841 [Leucogyrophana mollusca]|uniref:Uncharacterized protein n=1 Tax=Leucogyrophana mollusca TaxID=85980 RepID=A0ACB8BEP7_9AGAM|nr:hypothetical protein BV22DRAFT_1130841 [Leucogyrophana mollusca]
MARVTPPPIPMHRQYSYSLTAYAGPAFSAHSKEYKGTFMINTHYCHTFDKTLNDNLRSWKMDPDGLSDAKDWAFAFFLNPDCKGKQLGKTLRGANKNEHAPPNMLNSSSVKVAYTGPFAVYYV